MASAEGPSSQAAIVDDNKQDSPASGPQGASKAIDEDSAAVKDIASDAVAAGTSAPSHEDKPAADPKVEDGESQQVPDDKQSSLLDMDKKDSIAEPKATAPDAAVSPAKEDKGKDAQELATSEHAAPKTAAEVSDVPAPDARDAAKGVVAGIDALKDMMSSSPETRADEAALEKTKQLAYAVAAVDVAKAACEELKEALASEPSPEKEAELRAKLAEAEKDADAKQQEATELDEQCKAAEEQACVDAQNRADRCASLVPTMQQQLTADADALKDRLAKTKDSVKDIDATEPEHAEKRQKMLDNVAEIEEKLAAAP